MVMARSPLQEYPDTGFEYDRFYWSDLEPEEGVYNFAPIDHAFSVAAQHQPAMNVGLRIMALDEPQSGSKIPAWLIKKAFRDNGSKMAKPLSRISAIRLLSPMRKSCLTPSARVMTVIRSWRLSISAWWVRGVNGITPISLTSRR